jgi:hypothetical protein
VELTFRIYGQADGGTALWEQPFPSVAVEDGYFSVMLGNGTNPADGKPLSVSTVFAQHDATWITVCVGAGCTPDLDLKPRQQVGSVPYAMKSADSSALAGTALAVLRADVKAETEGLIGQAMGSLKGQIGFFAGPCPPGWSEYAPLRGRLVVGVPDGGTVQGTVGQPLGNLEARSHDHTYTVVIAHNHKVDPPSTPTSGPGLHGHSTVENNGVCGVPGVSGCGDGSKFSPDIGPGGDHSHSADIGPFDSGWAGSPAGTTASADHTLPYVQLRACQRN